MSIFLDKDSRIIVQGMTGGMGSKHTTLMVEAGANIVGGVNARKAGTSVELGGKELPVFGSVEEGRAILRDANHPLVTLAETMDEGADKAAELANA